MEQIVKRKKGRPDKIEPLKITMTRLWEKHPAWSDSEIKGELERILPKLIETIPEIRDIDDLPAVSTIADFRRDELAPKKREVTESGIDNPWQLGVMADKEHPEFHFHPEAVGYVLLVQEWAEQTLNVFKQPHQPLSIRQALWIARLYSLANIGFQSLDKKTAKKWSKNPEIYGFYFIWQWSEAYAARERLCQLANSKLDTAVFDKGIRRGELPITAGDKTSIIFNSKNKL